jgi:hypothetical protein
MHNLLRHPLRAYELERLLTTATPRRALPPLGDPAWTDVARRPALRPCLDDIRERALAEAKEALPPLPADLYAEFHRNGHRLGFERPYFARRTRLANAAAAFLFAHDSSDEQRHLLSQSFLDKLSHILDEESWALPAHVRPPSGQDPRQIDLFAAETANLMAELLVVFASVIPERVSGRIRARLRQMHEDYLDPEREYVWLTRTNNWNAVCHQGIIGSALLIEEDDAMVARLLARAVAHLPYFLEGFTADGGCSEGPGYWEYGFGWFAVLNEQLEARSGNSMSLLAHHDLMHRIALYGPQMCLSGPRLVTFSDCNPRTVIRPQLFQYLGQRFREPLLLNQARENYRHFLRHGLDLAGLRRDLFFYLRFLLLCPDDVEESPSTMEKPDVFFDQLGIIVSRGRAPGGLPVEFAAKGGHNAEHHNHNDCGSYLLHGNGKPVLADLGAPEYDRDFFRPETRYQNFAARTRGHSLPIINGCEQAPGTDFVSRIEKAELDPETCRFAVDLTACYPAEAGLRSLRRQFLFTRSRGVLHVIDDIVLNRVDLVESAIITGGEVEQRQDGTVLIKIEGMTFLLWPSPGARIHHVDTCDFRNHFGEVEAVRRIVLVPEELAGEMTLAYTVEPV